MWMIFAKEIKELLRDRKTLFFMIALPILVFPLIIGGVAYFSGKAINKAETQVLKISLIGSENGTEIQQALAASEAFEVIEMPADMSPEAWVKNDNVDAVLSFPDNASDSLLDGGQQVFKVYLNDAGLNLVEKRLRVIIDPVLEANQKQAFSVLMLTENQQQALLEPYVIEKIDVADKRENMGEMVGGIIPYFVFILCLQGAMLPASDLGAGEKERGTLETLLISPIERHKIVLGKFFAIAIAGVTSALITVFSLAVWGSVLSQGMAIKLVAEFMSAISVLDFLLVFLMLVPVVAIFASVLLSLSIYARSYKEAQGYMTPLVFVVIVPVILAMLPGIELSDGWAWVPLTNVALAMKELIKGTMDYFQLVAIFVSTAAIAGALLYFCIAWCNRETVLFR